jgi:hypothetical protein
MNYLVFLDPYAGELEKILSGVKSMILSEFNSGQLPAQIVRPGDSLYFLRNNGDYTLRVRATVVRVLLPVNSLDEELSRTIKELQPRLQLTEDQYNYWSTRKELLLVEFEAAQKIAVINVAPNKVNGRSDWIAFEQLSLIAE